MPITLPLMQVPITFLLIPGEKITARICTDLDGKVRFCGEEEGPLKKIKKQAKHRQGRPCWCLA